MNKFFVSLHFFTFCFSFVLFWFSPFLLLESTDMCLGLVHLGVVMIICLDHLESIGSVGMKLLFHSTHVNGSKPFVFKTFFDGYATSRCQFHHSTDQIPTVFRQSKKKPSRSCFGGSMGVSSWRSGVFGNRFWRILGGFSSSSSQVAVITAFSHSCRGFLEHFAERNWVWTRCKHLETIIGQFGHFPWKFFQHHTAINDGRRPHVYRTRIVFVEHTHLGCQVWVRTNNSQ